MPDSYRYILDSDVAETLFTLPSRQRDNFVSAFRKLAADPFQMGEAYIRDVSGRKIQQKQFGPWIISYWSDHPVKEVKIVAVHKVKS